jgi:hypothetical protein
MSWTLPLVLALAGTAATPPANLAFESGRLTGWEGIGFDVAPAKSQGLTRDFVVSSSDLETPGRVALIHRTFTVPDDAVFVRFTAAAIRPAGSDATADLDVILEAAGRDYLARQVHTADGWKPSPELLPPGPDGQPREYQWDVSRYAGRPVRIAIIDRDTRPGCFVVCGGFRIVPREDPAVKEFVATMLKLTREHKLGAMERLDSKHFIAITNADDDYTAERLGNCETIHALFFDHFRNKGFTIREPAGKLMVAVFDTEEGFDAYLDTRMPTSVTGVYHRGTNRLVVYDYASNRTQQALKRAGEQAANKITGGLLRQRVLGSINRQARERRDDANVGTIMHEVAHQLSFNCGLLNREGDVGWWLAEGLATYCESTIDGAWQGIGEPNPLRVRWLAPTAQGQVPFLPLAELIGKDDWIHKPASADAVLQGYSQSWALFQMLMEERPRALRKYLSMIYQRKTPDHRLADFAECFGDVAKFEALYQDYVRRIVAEQFRPNRR